MGFEENILQFTLTYVALQKKADILFIAHELVR